MNQRVVLHTGAALAAVATALLLRLALDPWLGNHHPVIAMYGAIAFVLWLSGWQLATVTAIAGYVLAHVLFIAPRGVPALGASSLFAGAVLYAFSCTVIIGLGAALRRAYSRAEATQRDLQREVTERRKTEAALRASEARFRIFMDNSPANAFVKDAGGRYLYMNRVMQSRFGADHNAWYGRTDDELLGNEAGAPLRANDRQVLQNATTARFEEHVGGPFGVRAYLSFKFPLTARDGVALLGGMAFDVTDLRRAEERARADLRAMTRLHELATLCAAPEHETHACLAQILDAAIEFTAAQSGALRLIDPATGALVLVAQRGLAPGFFDLIGAIQGDDEGLCAEALRARQRVLVENVATHPIFACVASRPLLLEAGVRAAQSTPLVTGGGKLVGVVATFFDHVLHPDEADLRLTDLLARQAADFLERRNAEDELLRLNAELRRLDQRKDAFIATLAHELRNPLAPICNAVQILRLTRDAADVETSRAVIERQSAHMARLLEDLLDVSRISRNRVELRRERVTLAAVLESAVETSRPLVQGGSHRLEIVAPAEPVYLQADPVRLAQVFSNLLNNAARYSDAGGSIRIRAEVDGTEVAIAVADAGHGIDAATLPHIFEMFAQGTPHGKLAPAGLGVGLSLARGLVALHGGRIDARSEGPGRGSEFIVHLPLDHGSDAPLRAAGLRASSVAAET